MSGYLTHDPQRMPEGFWPHRSIKLIVCMVLQDFNTSVGFNDRYPHSQAHQWSIKIKVGSTSFRRNYNHHILIQTMVAVGETKSIRVPRNERIRIPVIVIRMQLSSLIPNEYTRLRVLIRRTQKFSQDQLTQTTEVWCSPTKLVNAFLQEWYICTL
jgi:hypothetical protein